MLLDYTKQEKTKLNTLYVQHKPALDKAFETLSKAQDDFAKLDTDAQQGKRTLSDDEAKIAAELEKAQNEYWAIMAKYEHERTAITRKAEARELRYFTAHTDKLAERLQFEIEAQIVSFGMLQNHSDFQAVFQNDTEIKERLTATLEQYFDILKKHDIETYQLVIDFMEKAIADKEELTQAYRETLEEMPKEPAKSTRAINTWNKPYMLILQNNITNDFNRIARLNSTRGTLEIWDEQATYKQENMTLFIPHYDTLLGKSIIKKNGEISTPAKKVLDIATLIFTNNGHNPSIRFALDEYMSLCGLSDEKEARKQVNSALEALFDMRISYNDSKKKNKSRNYLDMRIIDAKGIKNGVAYLRLVPLYIEMLEKVAKHSVMPYRLDILKASKGTQNRNAFYIARKMQEHRYMNAGKINERRISIRTLLEAAPFLATEEEVRAGNRNFTDRITRPFMADLEEACFWLGIGTEGYELHYASGEKIPDKELLELKYETFIDAYVWFDELPDYPNQDKRVEKKKEYKQAAIATKKEKRKEKDSE